MVQNIRRKKKQKKKKRKKKEEEEKEEEEEEGVDKEIIQLLSLTNSGDVFYLLREYHWED